MADSIVDQPSIGSKEETSTIQKRPNSQPKLPTAEDQPATPGIGHPNDSPRPHGIKEGRNPSTQLYTLEGRGSASGVAGDAEPKQEMPSSISADQDADDIILEWTSASDPKHPLNWSSRRKWVNVLLIASQGLLSPLCSTILAAGSLELASDFHLTDIYTPNLPVGMYVLGLGLGPLCLGPLSEINGRRIVYLVCFFSFTVLQVGCALAPNITALTILRLASGLCGSAGPTLGGASIGDMFVKQDRGRAQAIYSLGPTTGPVIGPLVGAFIAARTHGWRWLMWVIAIAAGLVTVFSMVFLRETYAPFLQRQRVRKATKKSAAPSHESVKVKKGPLFRHAIIRPLRLLFSSPICTLMSIYMSM